MKYKYMNYIIAEFQKLHPTVSTQQLETKLQRASEDELYRIANAIERFGCKAIEESIICSH